MTWISGDTITTTADNTQLRPTTNLLKDGNETAYVPSPASLSAVVG